MPSPFARLLSSKQNGNADNQLPMSSTACRALPDPTLRCAGLLQIELVGLIQVGQASSASGFPKASNHGDRKVTLAS